MDALSGGPEKLVLNEAHWQTMLDHARTQAPEEACGLVGGQPLHGHPGVWICTAVLTVTNMLHSPVRYRMAPEEQLAAFEFFDRNGWELAAIFHSHPQGPGAPSPTDMAEAYYPEAAYLIWFQESGRWDCRAYRIKDGEVWTVALEVRPDSGAESVTT